MMSHKFDFFTPLPSVTLLCTLPYVLVSHNHKPPSPKLRGVIYEYPLSGLYLMRQVVDLDLNFLIFHVELSLIVVYFKQCIILVPWVQIPAREGQGFLYKIWIWMLTKKAPILIHDVDPLMTRLIKGVIKLHVKDELLLKMDSLVKGKEY